MGSWNIDAHVAKNDVTGSFSTSCSRHHTFAQLHYQSRTLAQFFGNLATILLEFYCYEGPVILLDIVVELSRLYLHLSITRDASRVPAALAHMADSLFALYKLNHSINALESSIIHYRRALTYRNLSLSQRANVEASLSYALLHRFKDKGQEDDCRLALEILITAQRRIEDGDIATLTWVLTVLSLLKGTNTSTVWSHMLVAAHELRELRDIWKHVSRKGLRRSRYILSLIAEGALAVMLTHTTQRQEGLHEGIECMNLALTLCSEEAIVLRYSIWVQLSSLQYSAHVYSFMDKDNAVNHLDASVCAAHKAKSLSVLTQRNSYVRWHSIHRWALATLQRALHCESLGGMEEAIGALKEAVFMCPESHSWWIQICNNLRIATGNDSNPSDPRRADVVIGLKSLLSDLSSDHELQDTFLACNIAEVMVLQAQMTNGRIASPLINRAIQLCRSQQKISSLKPKGDDQPYLDPEAVFHWTEKYLAQYETQANGPHVGFVQAQLDALLWQTHGNNEVELLGAGHLLLEQELSSARMPSAFYLVALFSARADSLFTQSEVDEANKARLRFGAWELYERAVNATVGRARERFQTSLRWAARATKCGCLMVALQAYAYAINILPHVVYLGEEMIDRIVALRHVSGLAASSAAASLTMGNVPMAIEFLERTRGILWLQSFQVRQDQLASLPISLREKILSIGLELENSRCLHWTTRRCKTEELGEIISEIRTYPGLERFQLPPLLYDIQFALRAKDAYAVVIVPNTSHCDVIILGMDTHHSDALHLRLSTFNFKNIQDLSRRFGTSFSPNQATQDSCEVDVSRRITRVPIPLRGHPDPTVPLLSELWTALVHPIVKAIRLSRKSRKRLWWCPIGPLVSLPLHAAGEYEGSSQDCIGNYTLSSYTPTITALYRLLTDIPVEKSLLTTPRVFLVSQPTSVGLPSLINADVEINQIKTMIPSELIINGEDSLGISVNDALNGLRNGAHVLHLACHGHQDQNNPLNSGFEFKDGRLTVQQLMHLSIPHAQLAYLSACDSAGIDESRPDEGLNLVGAMIFVGFKSVIGTMWAMDDLDGPFMAERIYARIFQEGRLNLDIVPRAVDDAVRELRDSGVPASRWATYVHFGL